MSKLYDLLNTIIGKVNKTVSTENQTLTENEKAQARANIGALSMLNPNDRELIVQEVITALGTPVFGRVDENKVITLTGALADGTYTFKYEDAEGNVTDLGTVTKAPKPKYTNVLPLAIGSDGKPYNGGQGWKTGTRLNSSGVESTSNASALEVTGFIPVKNGDIVYMSGVKMNTGTYANQTYWWLYDASFNPLMNGSYNGRYKLFSQYDSDTFDSHKTQGKIATDADGNVTMFKIDDSVFYTGSNPPDMSNAAYLRISCEEITNDSIITVNEPIE